MGWGSGSPIYTWTFLLGMGKDKKQGYVYDRDGDIDKTGLPNCINLISSLKSTSMLLELTTASL